MQIDQAVNMVLNLRVLGLEHYLLITFDVELCRTLDAIIPDLGGCVWTSLPVPQLGGSFEMWTMRKHYLGVMAGVLPPPHNLAGRQKGGRQKGGARVH
jgi:hypothetical protein